MLTLIADCGSTKIEWAVVNKSNKHPVAVKTFRTTGFNAAVTPPEEINRLLTTELSPELADLTISDVHFYGAGCIGGVADDRVRSFFATILPDAEIEIAGDLIAAARALFGHNPGIACILGTGSNCGLYDGSGITHNTPPMGYILGDEGSGAVMGRNLINLIFKHPGLLPTEIIEDFHSTYHLSKVDIIELVYRRPAANRFLASFCPFLKKHLSHPAIHTLVSDSFRSFLCSNLPANIPGISKPVNSLPIGFVGSIAYHFSSILRETCTQANLKLTSIIRSPLGQLIEFHS